MGGFGSGRTGTHNKAEHCRFIEVNRLYREGCLEDGYISGWQWLREGKRVANIGMACNRDILKLDYRVRSFGDDWIDVVERIQIERVPCRYGGTRPYFRCPGIVQGRACGRRVGKLFLLGRYFLCRHCHRIAYTSQSETELDRTYRKRDKRRVAMGAEPGPWGRIPPRPKGMWHRTYQRHIAAIIDADGDASEQFNRVVGGYLDRVNPGWRERGF